MSDKRSFITEKAFLFEYKTLTLDRLSKYLGLGPRQTERFLKQYYNQTFSQKRTAARMSAATVLLRNPDLTILDIAIQLGYSSIEYFSQVFKKAYQLSPDEYRADRISSRS